jgi:MYND finger
MDAFQIGYMASKCGGPEHVIVLHDAANAKCAVLSKVHDDLIRLYDETARKIACGDQELPDTAAVSDAFRSDELGTMAAMVTAVDPCQEDGATVWYIRRSAWSWIKEIAGTGTQGSSDETTARVLSRIRRRLPTKVMPDTGDVYVYVDWSMLLARTQGIACASCSRDGRYTCQGKDCVQRYCSRKCQRADWTRHKPVCGCKGQQVKMRCSAFIDFLMRHGAQGDAFCQHFIEQHL